MEYWGPLGVVGPPDLALPAATEMCHLTANEDLAERSGALSPPHAKPAKTDGSKGGQGTPKNRTCLTLHYNLALPTIDFR